MLLAGLLGVALLVLALPAGVSALPATGAKAIDVETVAVEAIRPAGSANRSARASGRRARVTERRFVPGQLLVRFHRGVDRGEATGLLDRENAELERRLPVRGLRVVELPRRAGVREVAEELEAEPGISYAEPNFIRTPSATPNDLRFTEQWGLHNVGQFAGAGADADIDAPEAWELTTGSPDVTVAVVDDGLAYDHPDLDGNLWRNPGESGAGRETNGRDDDANGYVDDWRGWDFADGAGDNDPYPSDSHGTHVAGIIGADGNDRIGVAGVSWDVSLMPLRVFGEGGTATSADIVAAFAYARKNGARVVNASFGGPGPSQAELDAILAAPQTLFSVAAGNSGQNNDLIGDYPCNYPAANVICVAASDSNDKLASVSNYGPLNVDLAAPGKTILSPVIETVDLLDESFEPPLAWTTGGVNDTWGLTDAQGSLTPYSLADSPVGLYQNDTDSWAQSPALDLSGLRGCRLFYELKLDAENVSDPDPDFLVVEASSDGASWEELVAWTGKTTDSTGLPTWFSLAEDLDGFSGSSNVKIRFRLDTDSSITRDGAYIDDPLIRCVERPSSTSHAFFTGTSMAAPMVSGATALILARFPTETVAQVRDRLLGSVDRKPDLAGKVATEGRLNVARALGATPPEPGGAGEVGDSPAVDDDPPSTRLVSGPRRKTRNRTPRFKFRSDDPEASFECKVDRRRWRECDSPKNVRVKRGRHRFRVRAGNAAGNVDPTPAKRRFRVRRR